ncbi:MAG TPA: AarF/ABC1/UbiB kinase family protein [Solirubrobacteraceae bacterium]|jgi:predicted unusual protein kinase regulating ubiquinone biosynthesis (AarF/ABC1/UbiB family)|nr:AarF/ABC1/UbiB kinase family protein [Solirubrobacteraceae bacterium]
MAKGDKIPTSRVSRTARIGGLAAGQAIREAGVRAANVTRSPEGRQVALERRQVEAAEQIVEALGTMKGAAMKVGQVLSFLDVGMVPEEYRDEFQRKLAVLRDAAPTVTFRDMRRVIEEELDDRLSDVFDEFDEEPVAAASIGQVYRARLADGREVAVKVQYPGVAAAVRADMQNLGLILRLAKRIAPGMDPKAIGEEIRSRIYEELDYELEASNQRTLARIFRGHPFIVVPDVITSLARERVMVSEFVHGTGFEELKSQPQEDRDRVGEIIYRFYFGCLYRHGQFSGDPHPGNSQLLGDGRMAFFDFGLFKRMPPGTVELEMQVARAIIEGDTDTIMRLGTDVGFFPDPANFNPDRVLAHFRAATSWYTCDREIELTPDYATQVLIDMSDPRSEYFGQLRHESAPPDHIFGRRMEVLTLAVISQLHARNNFHRIAREWFYGDPPATELGAQEAEFYSARAA